MANFKSDTVTAQEQAAAKAGKYIADAPLISGKLFFLQGKLTVPVGTAIADTFQIVKLPAGATVIPALCSVVGAAAGASSTLAFGFTGDTTALSTAVATSGAGIKPFVGNVGFYTNTADKDIIATLAGGALTAAVVLYFNIGCVIAE